MKNLVHKILVWLRYQCMTAEEKYLCQSADLADLERRLKKLQRQNKMV